MTARRSSIVSVEAGILAVVVVLAAFVFAVFVGPRMTRWYMTLDQRILGTDDAPAAADTADDGGGG